MLALAVCSLTSAPLQGDVSMLLANVEACLRDSHDDVPMIALCQWFFHGAYKMIVTDRYKAHEWNVDYIASILYILQCRWLNGVYWCKL